MTIGCGTHGEAHHIAAGGFRRYQLTLSYSNSSHGEAAGPTSWRPQMLLACSSDSWEGFSTKTNGLTVIPPIQGFTTHTTHHPSAALQPLFCFGRSPLPKLSWFEHILLFQPPPGNFSRESVSNQSPVGSILDLSLKNNNQSRS